MPRSDRRQFVLAIDLGSSGPKVALVADDGEMVAHARERVETFFLPEGGAEQDPDQWWRACTDGVRKVLDVARPPIEDVIGVTCTGQWSVTVPVDRAGKPLMRAVHWMDSRGAPYTARRDRRTGEGGRLRGAQIIALAASDRGRAGAFGQRCPGARSVHQARLPRGLSADA